MSRPSKILLISVLLVFALACNAVTQPIREAQEVVGTVQSVATAMPLETLQFFATSMPVETLEALPSLMPDFSDMFDPQGEPASEWNGIPIMPQATAGQEVDGTNYSFRFTGTIKEAQDFYTGTMDDIGWSSMVSMPGDANGAIMIFQKGDSLLTITIVSSDNDTVVVLTLA